MSYTVECTWQLLKRYGWSWQPGGRSSATTWRSWSGRRRPGRGPPMRCGRCPLRAE
nr:hypothetical protein [Streptomyces aureus]